MAIKKVRTDRRKDKRGKKPGGALKVGPRGAAGRRGAKGARGLTGPIGRRGRLGKAGRKGPKGLRGPLHKDKVLDMVMTHFDDVYMQLTIQMKRMSQIQQQVDVLIAKVNQLALSN